MVSLVAMIKHCHNPGSWFLLMHSQAISQGTTYFVKVRGVTFFEKYFWAPVLVSPFILSVLQFMYYCCCCRQTRGDASRLRGKRHISCILAEIDCVPEGVEYFSFQKMGEKRSFGDLPSPPPPPPSVFTVWREEVRGQVGQPGQIAGQIGSINRGGGGIGDRIYNWERSGIGDRR